MAESYGFFDAEELVGGEFDREYIAEQFANYFRLFIGNGVFASPTNQLKVVANSGMNVTLKAGWAFINGYWYHNDDDLTLSVPANATASTVTDGVFIQFDSSNREIKAIVAAGRTEVDRESPYYELKVAEITVATATTAITDAMITDTRTNENVCGFVKGLLEGVISTNDLFAQYTAIFNDWFDHMKDQLSEDAAGNLQEQIDVINGDIDSINDTLDSLSAATVSYDDTTTQLGANNVQTAIEKLKVAFSSALTSLKATPIAQAVGATGSTFAAVIQKLNAIATPGKSTSVKWSDNILKIVDGNLGSRGRCSDNVVRSVFELPAGWYGSHDGTRDLLGITDAKMQQLGWVIPSGSQSITANGNYDIRTKASVSVNVTNRQAIEIGYMIISLGNHNYSCILTNNMTSDVITTGQSQAVGNYMTMQFIESGGWHVDSVARSTGVYWDSVSGSLRTVSAGQYIVAGYKPSSGLHTVIVIRYNI